MGAALLLSRVPLIGVGFVWFGVCSFQVRASLWVGTKSAMACDSIFAVWESAEGHDSHCLLLRLRAAGLVAAEHISVCGEIGARPLAEQLFEADAHPITGELVARLEDLLRAAGPEAHVRQQARTASSFPGLDDIEVVMQARKKARAASSGHVCLGHLASTEGDPRPCSQVKVGVW